MSISKQICQINYMKKYTSSRFCGSCVVAGTLLCLILMVTLHLLRPDFNPLRGFLSEYAVGPFGFLVAAAACVLVATFLMLLAGLRLSVHPSGYLTASCGLLGVVIISLGVCAVFPLDSIIQPDGSHPPLTSLSRASIIHIVSSVLLYVSLIALLLTLSSAYKRDEEWRSFSQTTIFLVFLILVSFWGLILVPSYLRGLAQRGNGLVVLAWLLLTGLRLRQAVPSAHGTAA